MKLSIDTSFKEVSASLLIDSSLKTASKIAPMKQSEVLSFLIHELLSSNNLKSNDINEIYLSSGPGSFTGLRVSYAWAKGFAAVSNCKLVQSCIYKEFLKTGIFIMPSGKDKFLLFSEDISQQPSIISKGEIDCIQKSVIWVPNGEDLIPNSFHIGTVSELLFTGEILNTANSQEEIANLAPKYGRNTTFLTLKDRGL